GVSGKFCVTTAAGPNKTFTDSRAGSGSGTTVVDSGSVDCGSACIEGLDIDGDGIVDPQTDGMLIMRYLLGRPTESLVDLVGPGSSRTDMAAIGGYLEDLRPLLDIDGDGEISASTDAVLILRYLDGIRGEALIAGSLGPNA